MNRLTIILGTFSLLLSLFVLPPASDLSSHRFLPSGPWGTANLEWMEDGTSFAHQGYQQLSP